MFWQRKPFLYTNPEVNYKIRVVRLLDHLWDKTDVNLHASIQCPLP